MMGPTITLYLRGQRRGLFLQNQVRKIFQHIISNEVNPPKSSVQVLHPFAILTPTSNPPLPVLPPKPSPSSVSSPTPGTPTDPPFSTNSGTKHERPSHFMSGPPVPRNNY